MQLHADPNLRAVVLVSGGMDSAVTLAMARAQGFACHALSVAYGQRHVSELAAAARVARTLGAVEHKIVTVDLRSIGGSALTADRSRCPSTASSGIPVTYVPARNTIMLVDRARLGRSARRQRHLLRRQCGRLFRLSGLPARIHRRVRAPGQPGDQGRRRRRGAARACAADPPEQGRHRARRPAPRRRFSPRPFPATRPTPTAAPAAAAMRAVCARRDSPTPAWPIRRAIAGMRRRLRPSDRDNDLRCRFAVNCAPRTLRAARLIVGNFAYLIRSGAVSSVGRAADF